MPVYEFRCAQGHRFDRFLKLANYSEPQVCACGQGCERLVSAPFVQPDIAPYRSPIDDRWIDSRSQKREDLVRNGCVEWDPGRVSEQQARRRQEGERLETALEQTFEAEVAQLPARKKEILEQEVRAGATVETVRSTPPTAALV
jgi:putative FmdB family regulatory protein